MHAEAADTDDEKWLSKSIDKTLGAGLVGEATLDEARKIWGNLQDLFERAEFLIPHITNRYRSDSERLRAEAQLVSIQQEILRLSGSLASTFDMIGFLHHKGAPIDS